MIKKLLLVLFGICLISFVYAAGCCFDNSMGKCTSNTEQDSCSAGDWTEGSCDSVSECQLVCCILGNGVDFITAPTCYFKAQSMGLVENFQQISEVQCKKIQSKQKEGACIVTGRYEDKTCKYTTQASCTVGQFSEGILCSDPFIQSKFNVTCTKTKNTMCYNEDAHFVDSCGNPDVKKQDCDYDKGTICSMNKSSATCKSLDCIDDKGVNRKNGESWCYYSGAKLNYFKIEGSTRDEKYGPSEEFINWVDEKVGSEFYRKYCLNGKVEVEPCAGMRQEVCDVGKCVRNPWQDCLAAGNETKKDCDPKWCSVFVGHPGCGIIRAGETIEGGLSASSRISPEASKVTTTVISDPDGGASGGGSGSGGAGRCSYDDDCSADKYCLMGACTSRSTLAFLSLAKIVTGNTIKTSITGNAVKGATTATVDTPFCKGHNNEIMISDAELNQMGYTAEHRSEPEFRPQIRKDMIAASGMETCFPKYAGGFLYEKQVGSSSDSTYCSSYGGANAELLFELSNHDPGGAWFVHTGKVGDDGSGSYGTAGIAYLDAKGWQLTSSSGRLADSSRINAVGSNTAGGNVHEDGMIWVEPFFLESLNRRCLYTSDCVGQVNFLGDGGVGTNTINVIGSDGLNKLKCTASADNGYVCAISFQCMPYEASREGKCEECQADSKYACTEYKCRSIGDNCEFIDDLGINKAYCMKSSDISAPKILSHNLKPASPIKPFSSVQINLTTDEDSSCKFSLGKAGGKFEDMTFAFGNTWGKNHSLTLNIPGKIKENISDEEVQYEFLTRDGKYEMFVRCSDPKGNWNLEPYLIKFEVMDTPDSVPPALMYFNPKSGSPIEFDTTTKFVKFKINEPAACKWSLSDVNFSEMPYYFNCDLSTSRNGVLHGYDCSGTLTNISANLTKATTFYIRCKDQPWLAGNETKFYKRNENEKSIPYSLRNSNKLEIVEFAPKGMVVVGPSVNNLNLTVRTKGGGESGKAVCEWKRSYGDQTSLLKNFTITNAILHKQVISNISEGDYEYYVECTDIAGNKVNQTETLSIREDTGVPIISRVYNDKENLKIVTSEPAICKFSGSLDASVGCAFSLGGANLTSMTSKAGNLEHSGPWKKGNYYYIKCQDLHGNTNSVCGIAGKAV